MGVISPLPMVRNRVCLKCDRSFLSQGPHNRICPACKQLNFKLVQAPDRVIQKQRGLKYHNGEVIEPIDDGDGW